MLANVALALEYEAICKRTEHLVAAGLSSADVEIFITAVVAMVEPVESHFMWRPQLRDPDDELVLEAAVNRRAAMIVTFNQSDFRQVPSRFGIDVVTPAGAIGRIGS
jgi:predicted nucleic acid-binding protein